MLDTLLFGLNAVACAVIAWTALSYFLMRGEPHDLWSAALQLGLVLVIASAAATPFALAQTGEPPSWWAVMQRTGGAILAGCFYEWRFGMKRQFLHLKGWTTDWLARARAGLVLLKGLRRGRKT